MSSLALGWAQGAPHAVSAIAWAHCTMEFTVLPPIAGYVARRVAGHYRGLNGMLAMAPMLLIVTLMVVRHGAAFNLSPTDIAWGAATYLCFGWFAGNLGAHLDATMVALVAYLRRLAKSGAPQTGSGAA